jgi:hypothetical protein
MTLPDNDFLDSTCTTGGGGMLVPTDEQWYRGLYEAVTKGLQLLVFPETCDPRNQLLHGNHLRRIFGLEEVRYGPRTRTEVHFPQTFGGGTGRGMARQVMAAGEPLLTDIKGDPILVQRQIGKGAVLLAGYDGSTDSLDGDCCYEHRPSLAGHTLARLCQKLAVGPLALDTRHTNVFKEVLRDGNREFLVMFSHLEFAREIPVRIRLKKTTKAAMDLATSEILDVNGGSDGWYSLTVPLEPRVGRYLSFEHDC